MDEMTAKEVEREFSNSIETMATASVEDMIGVSCQLADVLLCKVDAEFEGLPTESKQMAVFGLISRMLTDMWAHESAMQNKQ